MTAADGAGPDAAAATPERGIRVLIVDDQALVRAGFRTILDSEPGIDVVGEAADGGSAVDAAAAVRPDVICMDVQMPGMDGLEATRRILDTAASEPPAVLMLTTFDREDYLFAALEAGASGFLLKNSSPEQLIEAVQVVARGDALLSPDVTRRVIEAAAAGRRTLRDGADGTDGAHAAPSAAGSSAASSARPAPAPAATASALDDLTAREREVLELLAEGLSNAEIAGRMWVGEATVKTHVSKVLMKLGLRDRVHAVVYAYEHGVVRPPR